LGFNKKEKMMGRLHADQFENFYGINLKSDVFVETGTFLGESLTQAITAGFSEVHTVDVVAEYTENAKLANQHCKHVYCHTGTSPDVLPRILDKSKSYTFWLDAHYQAHKDNETCEKYGQCPVMAELKVIFAIDWKQPPIILIDDAKMFHEVQGPFNADEWPTLDQIAQAMPQDYQLQEHDDILIITHKSRTVGNDRSDV
jgi:hypothetical protein